MSIRGLVGAAIRHLRRRFERSRGDPERENAPAAIETTVNWTPTSEVDPRSFDPEKLTCRQDCLTELGLAPEAFVVRLLEDQGGQLPQQAFAEYTAWSDATISRLLQELEADEHVVRVAVGRQKVVYLPDHAPETGDDTSASDTSTSDDTSSSRVA